MGKRFLVVFFVLLLAAGVLANFKENEKPITALQADTAYTLNGGEWNIEWGFPEVAMPVTYGIVDGLQVGSRFFVWFLQAPNVYLKWNIIPESEAMPALAVGGSFWQVMIKDVDPTHQVSADTIDTTLMYYNISAYITKQLSDVLYLSGSYTYNRFDVSFSMAGVDPQQLNNTFMDALKQITGREDPTGLSHFSAALIYQMSSNTRLLVESIGVITDVVNLYAGAGFYWALGDSFRLKIGVLTVFGNTNLYLPTISIGGRF